MVKAEGPNGHHHPDCIIREDNTVVSWDEATEEMQNEWLEQNTQGKKKNGNPDKGNGKAQRKKKRRSNSRS
jgi:hypothetical protein